MGYVPYGLLLLLLFILLLLTVNLDPNAKPAASPHRSSPALQTRSPCFTVGELHKDVQAIKVHMGRMVHEWETYTEDTGFTRAPAVGLVFLPLK